MARSDRAGFLAALRTAETEMNRLFGQMAGELREVVLRAAGDDGTIPVERIPEVERQAHRIVDRYFLAGGRAFDDANEPLSPYARVISTGQRAMIDQALERQAKLLDRLLPADVREGLRERYQQAKRG